jgi:hypothetical protein
MLEALTLFYIRYKSSGFFLWIANIHRYPFAKYRSYGLSNLRNRLAEA